MLQSVSKDQKSKNKKKKMFSFSVTSPQQQNLPNTLILTKIFTKTLTLTNGLFVKHFKYPFETILNFLKIIQGMEDPIASF